MEKIEQIIAEIKHNAKEKFVPIVRDKTLEALKTAVATINPQKVLEIGTAVGYSALNILSNGNCHLTTIEKDETRYAEAMANFDITNVLSRVRAINGDAINILQRFIEEDEKFDFVFLDGPKGQYIKYLPLIKKLLNDGGVIFADNVSVLGLVGHEELVTRKNRTMVRNMQTFLDTVKSDADFKMQIFDVEDGYAVIHKVQKNDRKD